jgi:enoyl-CoA hydratase/carnithine racemase
MIIAGEAATFDYPEIDVGLIPALHFVHLPPLVGKHQAFGPLFLGDSFDAATAFRGEIADRHENRPRCLHARGRRGLPPRERERGREFCRDDTRTARKALMPSSKSDRQNIPGADPCYLAAS